MTESQPLPAPAQERRRYRKIYARLWLNPVFRSLSDGEKVVAIYLLSGPQTNRIGLYKLNLGAACDDLCVDRKDRLLAKIVRCVDKFEWFYDNAPSVVWVPSWWAWNPPAEKVNNFRGALTDLHEVPPSPLIARFCNNLRDIPVALHPYIQEWLTRSAFSNTVPTQPRHSRVTVGTRARASQEQEQEKDSTDRTTAPKTRRAHPPVENAEPDHGPTTTTNDPEPRAQSPEPEPPHHDEPEPPPAPPHRPEPTNGSKTRHALAREPAPDENYRAIRKAAFEQLTAPGAAIADVGELEHLVKFLCASRGIAYGPHEVGDALERACNAAWSAFKLGVTR